MTVHEDRTRQTVGNASRVIASLDNLVIGLLRYLGETKLTRARRKQEAQLTLSGKLVTLGPTRP